VSSTRAAIVEAVSASSWTAKGIASTARVVGLGFAVLVAVGVLVKAAGGPTGLAIAFAAIGVVGGLLALSFELLQQRVERGEDRAALWWKPPDLVRELAADDGIYGLGVETEALEALEAADLHGFRHAPYVPRDLDRPLSERLSTAATLNAVTLIVVSGPSKAGKSRTLLEAARVTLGHAWLIAPKDAEALARLARGGPPPEVADGPCAIWLDDIEPFAVAPREDGLNAGTLEAFQRWGRPVLVLATAGGKGGQLVGSEGYVEPTHDLLRAHPGLELDAWLSEDERVALGGLEHYTRAAAERIAREGIGEFMIAASQLRKKLAGGSRCPEGLAITQAAIDWRRLGLIRSVPRAALHALYVHYLPGPDSPERFERGLEWATTPLYSQVALLQGRDEYEPYDYIVRYEHQRRRPVPPAIWDLVLDTYADDDELSAVGLAAIGAADQVRGERAFRRGDQRGDGVAVYNLGVLLRDKGDLEGAEAAFRRGDERGVGAAASSVGLLLVQRGDVEAAEAAFRRGDARGDASAASNLGLLLSQQGDLESAEAAYRRGDERGDGTAASNLGALLLERGDVKGAEAAFRRGEDRGGRAAASNGQAPIAAPGGRLLGVAAQPRVCPELSVLRLALHETAPVESAQGCRSLGSAWRRAGARSCSRCRVGGSSREPGGSRRRASTRESHGTARCPRSPPPGCPAEMRSAGHDGSRTPCSRAGQPGTRRSAPTYAWPGASCQHERGSRCVEASS
jgi:tetratricopeptide (TPR) repeat protein